MGREKQMATPGRKEKTKRKGKGKGIHLAAGVSLASDIAHMHAKTCRHAADDLALGLVFDIN
jgi:hypothetical protein